MADLKIILNSTMTAAAKRALPPSARDAARHMAMRAGMIATPPTGAPCQVLFVTSHENPPRNVNSPTESESPLAEEAQSVKRLRNALEQRGITTDEIAIDDFSEGDEERSQAMILCCCPNTQPLHDAIIKARGRHKKTFYHIGDPASFPVYDAASPSVKALSARDQIALENAALRHADALELCDEVIPDDIPDDDFVELVRPIPQSIESAYAYDPKAGTAAVERFLQERGLALPNVEFNPQPWADVPLSERIARLDASHLRGVKVAALLYERECGDDATFRYYGFNVSERLAASTSWDGVYFFTDELPRLKSHLASIDLAVLIRMRYRPDVARFVKDAHRAHVPVACFIDDNAMGLQMAPRVARAMMLDFTSEFERNFWYGAAMRFELTADLCDCFIASTGKLAEVLQERYGKPAFVIGPSLNDMQVEIAQSIVNTRQQPSDRAFTIGYFSGTSSHNEDFALVKAPLMAFLDTNPDARLLLVGSLRLDEDLQDRWRAGQVTLLPRVDFATLSYLQAAVDVVLAPLVLDEFTECKSNLKVFEAGVVGTPACASASPSYSEAIAEGSTGFLCSTDESWLSALEALHREGTAQQIGDAARERALSQYYGDSVQAMAEGAFEHAAASAGAIPETEPAPPAVEVSDWDDPFQANVAFGRAARRIPADSASPLSPKLELVYGAFNKARREGLQTTANTTTSFVKNQVEMALFNRKNTEHPTFFDVMFVNGCSYALPHPIRYRVDHQIQQLMSNGLSLNRIDAWNLKPEHVGCARAFIFFRCPYTSELGEFVALAKRLNKAVYYDIDDLVVSRTYTDTIKFLDTMSDMERAGYDDGVDSMGKMLRACGRAITTTERLAEELSAIVPEVFINRNTASEDMLLYSNRALRERDVLPFVDASQLAPEERAHRAWALRHQAERSQHGVTIGYFSGSITHNADMELIMPALVDVMAQRPDVCLCVAGILDIPDELLPFKDRVITCGFGPWKRLPDMISDVDINIAPLEDSIFNEAKSENKWVEAALVKVPTVASDIGAFATMIEDGKTGVLCRTLDDWRQALLDLVDDPQKRRRIGEAAYDKCMRCCTTIATGHKLASYLRSQFSKNLLMVMPGLNISGGVLVALKHCAVLQRAGYDVTIIDASSEDERYGKPFVEADGCLFPVIRGKSEQNVNERILLRGSIDQMVATMWTTALFFDECPHIARRQYLVQNFETDFYEPPDFSRIRANATYMRDDTEYLTISQWCKDWLENHFGQQVRYAPNGIDTEAYPVVERTLDGTRKTRILIEGDAESYYKNVDEAFAITNQLDPQRYEIWYMSYNAGPKSQYRVDRFLHKVPHDKVGEVYASCDILLKTSILESFSYPPLEMMATGGFVVAIPNEGNGEYLRQGFNCLLFESGDTAAAIASIQLIETDPSLRERLKAGGLKTANDRDWSIIEQAVLDLYA